MLRRVLLMCGLMLVTAAVSSQPSGTSPAAVSAADFFRRPALSSPRLSPDGSRIAMLLSGPAGRTVLAVADVNTPKRRVGIARFSDADVRSFQWVNDRRLVFDAVDFQAPLGEQFGAGLYAVDADGKDFVWLVGRGLRGESEGHVATRPLRWNHVLLSTLRDGSDDVVVARYEFRREGEPGSSTPLRLNTRTRSTREIAPKPPEGAADWVLDRTGVPRAAVSMDAKGLARVLLRKSESEVWVEIDRYDINDPPPGSISPEAFDAEGQLMVKALRNDAARTLALFRFNAETNKKSSEPIFALKGYDFTGRLIFDQSMQRLVGATFLSDAAGSAWFDPEMKAIQEQVDALLSSTANIVHCEACLSQRRFIVSAWSDRQSPVYFLFDKSRHGKEALSLIGASRPWIDAAQMAAQDQVYVKARDGLEFPVYITKPRGKGPWPTVVLVHGGPYVRGVKWEWNADAQFLASRGYLVVEPEFRGSTGYGDRLFRAGWKQWGLKMQDDITDATHWAIKQGLADPKRLAIAGASYGGYATMMGLVREPDLYRAGINWVGVTDIDLMYSIDWSDFDGSVWQRYGMPKLVGDRVADRAQLAETSPLKRAAEITKPVLMAYGTKDFRVPLPHGVKMRDALKAAGKAEVEWVEYEEEGHGFLLEKNQVDFWQRVERFLARHLR